MRANTNHVTPPRDKGFGGNNVTINGPVSCLNALAGWPWLYTDNDNFSSDGGTLLTVISNLPAVLAGGYSICFVQGCHNDFISGHGLNAGANNVASHYKYIINILLSNNILPVIILGPPNNYNLGSKYVTLEQLRKLNLAANAWKRHYCQHIGEFQSGIGLHRCRICRTGAGLGTKMTADGAHPSPLAYFQAAKQGLIDLAHIIPPPINSGLLQTTVADVYDATFNPFGNLLRGGGLFWSGGGAVNSGAIGTVARNYTFQKTNGLGSGGTRTASLMASSDGIGQWQELSFRGTATEASLNEEWTLFQFITQGSLYVPGDVIEGAVEFSVGTNSPFNGFGIQVIEQNKDGSRVRNETNWQAPTGYIATTAWSGVMRTAPITVPADAADGTSSRALFPRLHVNFDNSGNNFSGIILFRRFTVRKVPQV